MVGDYCAHFDLNCDSHSRLVRSEDSRDFSIHPSVRAVQTPFELVEIFLLRFGSFFSCMVPRVLCIGRDRYDEELALLTAINLRGSTC